jgi:protein TonB
VTFRAWLNAAIRVGGALLPNLALIVVLTRLNRAEAVDADPAVVARLRLAALPAVAPPPRELEPRDEPEPEPEVADVDESVPPEAPVADIEPLAVPTVALACSVRVMVRPVPAAVRPPPRRVASRAHRPVRRRTPPPARTLGEDEVDRPPRELNMRQPAYPDSAQRFGIQGSATVRLLIDEEGRVVKAELLESPGSRLFGRAVLAVAKEWRFTPASDHGRKVSVWAIKKIHFRLRRSR